jgi:hypothetical protein
MIACSWLSLLSYLTAIIDLMVTSKFTENFYLILIGVIICTYATTKYIDIRNFNLLSNQVRNLKELWRF